MAKLCLRGKVFSTRKIRLIIITVYKIDKKSKRGSLSSPHRENNNKLIADTRTQAQSICFIMNNEINLNENIKKKVEFLNFEKVNF